MRLLLATVILMGLISSSSGDTLFWSYIDLYASENKGNESTFSLPAETKKEEFTGFVLGNISKHQLNNLNDHLGNTIYAMILQRLDKYATLPDYYRKALDNGVLCEVNRKLHEGTIRSIQYHADFLTEEQREKELEAAKHPSIGIHCGTPRADYLFCRQEWTLLYSAALLFRIRLVVKGVKRSTCEHELLDSVDARPPLTRPLPPFVAFYVNDRSNEKFVKFFNDPRPELQRDQAHFWAILHCQAVAPETESDVKTIFAANALRWTLEGYVLQEVFNRRHKDIDSACAEENFATSEVGKCACTKDTGFSFCAQKVRAQYFKKIDYLNCTSMRFEKPTRPETIPPFSCHADAKAAATGEECAEYRKSMQ